MTPPLELYFMSTVAARDTDLLPVRQAIVSAMEEHGTVLDRHVVRPDAYEIDRENSGKGVDIRARDYAWLDRARAGVAELSVPSTGAGMEVERFSVQGKPLLVLHKEDRSPSLAGYLPRSCPNVKVSPYATLDEAVRATHEFLRALPPRPLMGRFIVIDGPDYCGKGTQHRMLIEYLLDHPQDRDLKLINPVPAREPFNTDRTLMIREMLRTNAAPADGGWTLARLFVEDRSIHASQIRMLVAGGNIVVSDRYKYSTLAYQSLQGVPMEDLLRMHDGLPVPDLTFFIMTSLERRLQRKANDRNRPYTEVFEKDREFQAMLQHKYPEIKESLPDERIIVVDGDRERHEIQAEIRGHVDKLIFG